MKRKIKKNIKKLASKLPVGAYAIGCRGHAGTIIERHYNPRWGYCALMGSDVVIKSLVDGVQESCSLRYCAPEPITQEDALRHSEMIRTHHAFDVAYAQGCTLEEIKEWVEDWENRNISHYVIWDSGGYECRSTSALTIEMADKEAARLAEPYFAENGVRNVRIVDVLSYPAPPMVKYR